MRKRAARWLLGAALLAGGCADSTAPGDIVIVTYDFDAGTLGWVAAFADYPVGAEQTYGLQSGHASLPQPLDTGRKGFRIRGINHSDELFMYLRRQVTGLAPDADYGVRFQVRFATNAPAQCAGVGGAPGESVIIKAGATAAEPVPVVAGTYYRLSVDKGDQFEQGEDVLILGNIATNNTDCHTWKYELKTLSPNDALVVRTDAAGRIWLFVGSESGFESETALFFTRVEATFTRR